MSEIIITPSDPIDITLSNEFNTIELTSETNEIVISEKGVQGSQGARGSQGEKGDTGDKGDTGEGVPSGGTSGQILTKVDDTDYNTEWTDVTDTLTWIDVAGDVEYTGAETTIASGDVLTADYKGSTVYRFINSTENANGYPLEDSFYSDFDGTNLTNLISTRGV